MLEGMGFPRVRCEKAMRATRMEGAEGSGGYDLDAATNWILMHMDDPGMIPLAVLGILGCVLTERIGCCRH